MWSPNADAVSVYAGAICDQPEESAIVLRAGARWFAGEPLATFGSTRCAPMESIEATSSSACPVRWDSTMESLQSELGLLNPTDWGLALVY